MKMKHLIAILILAILLSALPGALAEEQTAMDRVQCDWLTMLSRQDDCCSQEQYALNWMLQLCEDPTWENLIKARTAAQFTLDLLEFYAATPWEATATSEDYNALIAQGMDIADAQLTLNGYGDLALSDASTSAMIWQEFAYALMFDAYDQAVLDKLQGSARQRMESVESCLREWYLMTNYIALELPEKDAQTLTRRASDNAPAIMAAYEQPFETVNDVLNEYDALVREDEENLLSAVESLTRTESSSGDFDADAAQAIEGLPELILPCPQVWEVQTCDYVYYWKSESGELRTPTRRMDIQGLPNQLILTLSESSLESYQAYVSRLLDAGLEPSGRMDTAVSFSLADGILFLVSWDEAAQCLNIAVQGGQVCLAPDWVLAKIAP